MSDISTQLKKLVIASGNAGKIKEFRNYLANLGVTLILKPDSIDVEETGATFIENAHLKASQVAIATGEWAIADDSGLGLMALQEYFPQDMPIQIAIALIGFYLNLRIRLIVKLSLFARSRSPHQMVRSRLMQLGCAKVRSPMRPEGVVDLVMIQFS